MSSHYRPTSVARTFPKIAVVCGAHTDLGQRLVRELLQSSEIETVHAIAATDIPLLNNLSKSLLLKARVHPLPFDGFGRVLDKIDEADMGFCCLGTDRHAYETIGLARFRFLNYEAPARFVNRMFELGVLYMGVLSHEDANQNSRSELNKSRGELEEMARSLRLEAADFSPYVTIFKTRTLSGHRGSSSSGSIATSRNREDNSVVRDVAKAMKTDALEKSVRRRSAQGENSSKYSELYVGDIEKMLRDARKAEQDNYELRVPFWED